MKPLCLAIGMLLGGMLGLSKVMAQVHTAQTVVGSGAQHTLSNGVYTISGTFGQPIIGTRTIAEKTTFQGFWLPIARTASAETPTPPVAGSGADQIMLRATENPFSTSTELVLYLPQSGEVSVRLYDGVGREVGVLLEGTQTAGTHRIPLDAHALSSGHYVVHLVSGTTFRSLPLLLVE